MSSVEKIEVDVSKQGHITNSYLIYDENKEAVLIDPGFDEKKIIYKIKDLSLKVRYIIITHAHGDHIGALEKVQKYTNSKIIIHENDYNALISKEENYSQMLNVTKQNLEEEYIIKVENGYILEFSRIKLEIIHTPGHSSGSICIYDIISNRLFTGDTIFCDCYGRCDLHTGNFEEMVNSIKYLFNRFNNINIYPGHEKIVNIEVAKKYIKMLISMKGIIL